MTRKSKSQPEQPAPEEEPIPQSGNVPDDESLSATRKALIKEEQQAELKGGVLKKVAHKLKGKKTAKKTKPVAPLEEIPATTSPAPKEDGSEEAEAQEILSVLEKAGQEVEPPAKAESPQPVVSPSPEPKQESLASIPKATEPVDLHDLRDVALEGYEETPAQSPAGPRKSISRKIKGWADRIQYRTLVRMTIASLTAVVCLGTVVVALFLLQFQPIRFSRPATPTPTMIVPTAALPVPMQVRFPGGWAFVLSRGRAVDGKWTPTSAEWLEGTEICRWVSLPWTEQLEAVIKTFKPGDRIDLVMTNYDHWTYRVRSVSEAQSFELATMDKNFPSLLLILTKADSDERLVVLAVP